MSKALELQPDQPHVLNYLGYSWIDQGINLDEGMKMIKRAVEQRPDDGYIVDSLGWAYYRIGNYDDAVKNLERAIDLKPEDPTINDHLGDAYWRVGRTLEAKFQWAHARDLKPEPEDLPKIEAKIAERSCPTTPPRPRLPPRTRKKKTTRAADRRRRGGCSPMPALVEDARAKVNLTLRVVGRRVDGYHDLESVVAFADCADRLESDAGRRAAARDHRTAGAGLRRGIGQSGVQGRASCWPKRVPNLKLGDFALDKVLPVAAGIGGGSADAAAALRLLARLNDLALDDPRLIEVARLTGADVPVCLASRACVMTGVGETLLPLALPEHALRDGQSARARRHQGRVQGARPAQRRTAGRRHRRARGGRLAGEPGASIEDWVEALAAGPTISKRRRCASSP